VAAVTAGEGGVVYTFRDVTTDHALERLRAEVVAVVSHELRTPLTGVYGSAQTLLAHYDALDDATRRQLLETVVQQADRLAGIIDRILVTNRLDTEDVELRTESVVAAVVVDAVLSALPAGQRDRVVVEGATDVRISGDAAAVRQIVPSLVDNALKYSAAAVFLRIDELGATVRFTVVDSGPGVPPIERQKIFERFYRLDPDQRSGVGGIGLGLYIARQLTERLGGTIDLLPGGTGTTIFVDLPSASGSAARRTS
jgi:signal transduction histidine kinase